MKSSSQSSPSNNSTASSLDDTDYSVVYNPRPHPSMRVFGASDDYPLTSLDLRVIEHGVRNMFRRDDYLPKECLTKDSDKYITPK